MNLTRRMLSLLIGAALALSLCACGKSTQSQGETYETAGLKLHYTKEFQNTKGVFCPQPYGQAGEGISLMRFYYYALPERDYEEITRKEELSEEDIEILRNSLDVLLDVISVDESRGEEEALKAIGSAGETLDLFAEIGKAGGVTFYIMEPTQDRSEYYARVGTEYAEEYKMLHDALIGILKNAEFFAPSDPGAD